MDSKKTIIISLDNYEEMFDDFDISKIEERAFSYDFLLELKRRAFRVKEPSKIILTIPKEKRKKQYEKIILRRLKHLFNAKMKMYNKRYKDTVKRGLTYFLIGVSFLLVSSYVELLSNSSLSFLFSNFLLIPSWFFVWSGLDKILESSEKYKKRAEFFKALYSSKIIFDKEEKYEN